MLRPTLVTRAAVLPVLGVALGVLGLTSCGGADDASAPAASATATTGSESPAPSSSPQSGSASGSASGSPSASPSQDTEAARPDAPDCASLWTAGGRIPRFYPGCNDGDTFVVRDSLGCSSGQRLARYDDRFYGVLGGTVTEAKSPLERDKGYRDSVARCRA